MKVSVLIPTVGREEFLRTSLRSVAAQTAAHLIGEVVVSDNRPCGVAEKVSAEFPSLPIRIVRREPPLGVNVHFQALPETALHELTAILHDDDWWAPSHLDSALAALAAVPGSVACYTAFAEVPGERSPSFADPSLGVWFAADGPALDRPWALDLASTCIASLPGTFGRFSALVARTDALRRAGYVYDLGNPFDTDRMLGVALALEGPLAYSPLATAYIRRHPAQDGGRYGHEAIARHMSDTSRWLLTRADERGLDLVAEIRRRIESCPADLRHRVAELWRWTWTQDVLRERGLWPEAFAPAPSAHGLGVRDFLPPLLVRGLLPLRDRFRSDAP